MWQELIVAVCVISAFIFLIRKWFFAKSSASCGGCTNCESKTADSCQTSQKDLPTKNHSPTA